MVSKIKTEDERMNMKTAEEKANDFLVKHVGEWNAKQERELIALLKRQDRDTRHACAEAILAMQEQTGDDVVISQASAIAMNTKAV